MLIRFLTFWPWWGQDCSADTQFLEVVETAVARMDGAKPEIIEVPDNQAGFPATGRYVTYEAMTAEGDPNFDWVMPEDEWNHLPELHLGNHRKAQGGRATIAAPI